MAVINTTASNDKKGKKMKHRKFNWKVTLKKRWLHRLKDLQFMTLLFFKNYYNNALVELRERKAAVSEPLTSVTDTKVSKSVGNME